MTDAGAAHTVNATPTCTASAWTATLDLTTLNDGTLTATATQTDADGNTGTRSLTATKDVAAPTVSSTIPAGSATGVALNSVVTINWSEPVDCTTVTTSAVTIAPALGGWTRTSCGGSQAAFTRSGQASGTEYTITVGTGVTDLAGNPMAANYPFSYDTQVCYTLTTAAAPQGSGSISAAPLPNCNSGTQYTRGYGCRADRLTQRRLRLHELER